MEEKFTPFLSGYYLTGSLSLFVQCFIFSLPFSSFSPFFLLWVCFSELSIFMFAHRMPRSQMASTNWEQDNAGGEPQSLKHLCNANDLVFSSTHSAFPRLLVMGGCGFHGTNHQWMENGDSFKLILSFTFCNLYLDSRLTIMNMKTWKRQNSVGAQCNLNIQRRESYMMSGPCTLASKDYLLQASPHPGTQSFRRTLEHGWRFPLPVFAWLSSFSTSSVAISEKIGWLGDFHSVFLTHC